MLDPYKELRDCLVSIRYWIQCRKDIQRWKGGQASSWRCPHCWERHYIFTVPTYVYGNTKRRFSLFLTSYNYWLRTIFSICSRCGMKLYGGLEKSLDLVQWIDTDDIEESIDIGKFFEYTN